MKKTKYLITSALATPMIVLPTTLSTSCSVYTNMIKYTPTYEPYASKVTTVEEANNAWFNYVDNNDKLRDEILSTGYMFSLQTFNYEYLTSKIQSKGKPTSVLFHMVYANIDTSTHKISFKFDGEVDIAYDFFFEGTLEAKQYEHYSFNFEIKNMVFVVDQWEDSYCSKTFWSFLPKKIIDCSKTGEIWTTQLTGDEEIIYNLKYTSDIRNNDNKQQYAIQTSEGAQINEKYPLTVDLSWFVNNLVINWSYYLSKSNS